jgi:predicted nucleotidyltransferase
MITQSAETLLLRTFCLEPFHSFSVAELSSKTGVSRNWIYKLLDEFKVFDLLLEERKTYRLDFSNLLCRRIKTFFDAKFIFDSPFRDRILRISEKITYEMNPVSIVLVGSVAVGREREISDIDFLVISGKKRVPLIENTNIIVMTRLEFEKKYAKGDDFIVSALAYGKIIYDKEFFIRFYEKPLPAFTEETIQEKIHYCEKLQDRIYSLLRSDEERAREETLHLTLQCARIVLLRQRIIPGTKYDITEQVKKYDEELAYIIEELMKSRKIAREKILEFLRKCRISVESF